MLYPKVTSSRNLMNLAGVWNFKADYKETGYKDQWYQLGLKKL